MTKILDIQESITAVNGNVTLAKDLFAMLLDDLDLRHQQISNTFQANNMESLAEHIHKLYGATAYCIVPKLRNAAEVLEDALKHKDYLELEQLVEAVLQEINQLMNDGPVFIEKEWLDFKVKE